MRNGGEKTMDMGEFIEQFVERVFEGEIYGMGYEVYPTVQNAYHIFAKQKYAHVNSVLERIDPEALNKFSIQVIESVVKRLEFQLVNHHLVAAKLWLHIFTNFAIHSSRFRSTIRHSHNVHVWLALLRNALQCQWDSSIIEEMLNCTRVLIGEINAAFNMEYVYWKKYIPELMDLYSNVFRKGHMNNIERIMQDLFTQLLKADYSFMAHAHTQLESKRFLNIVQIANIVTKDKEIDPSNSNFCRELAEELRTQEWPEGVGDVHGERRRVQVLTNHLESVWNNRVHRADDQPMSDGSSGDEEESSAELVESADDEEEETQPSQQQPLLKEATAFAFNQNQQAAARKQLSIQQRVLNFNKTTDQLHHPLAAAARLVPLQSIPLPVIKLKFVQQQQQHRPAVKVEEEEQEDEGDEDGGGLEEAMDQQQPEVRTATAALAVNAVNQPENNSSPGGNGRKRVAGAGQRGTQEEEEEDGGSPGGGGSGAVQQPKPKTPKERRGQPGEGAKGRTGSNGSGGPGKGTMSNGH